MDQANGKPQRMKALFTRHWVFRLIFLPLASIYLVLLLVAWSGARLLLYPMPPPSYEDSAEIIKLRTADGLHISARYLPKPGAVYTVLYSHGNGEDMGMDEVVYQNMRDYGFSVMTYDYHGYGTSEGSPSEQALYHDIDAVYAYMTGELGIAPSRIIVYGRSLGSGPSVYLAEREPVAGLILESSFATAFRARTRVGILPFDQFPNIQRIKRVRCPILFMHGRKDLVIAFSNSKALYKSARAPKMHLWVKDAGHNDFQEKAGERYQKTIFEFITLVEATQRVRSQSRKQGAGGEVVPRMVDLTLNTPDDIKRATTHFELRH